MAVKTKQNAPQKSKTTAKNRTAPKKRPASAKSSGQSALQKLMAGKRKWFVVGAFILLFGGIGAYMLRSSNAYTVSCGQYSYNNSTSYSCVKYIQRMINGNNYIYTGGRFGYVYYSGLLDVDGYFGSGTKAAVMAFQKSSGGQLEVDGIVGPKTWDLLCYRAQKYRYDTTYVRRTDGYNAAVSAGCQGSGFATTTTTVSSSAPVSTSSYDNQITSCYGWRDGKLHSGVDIDGSNNRQPIYAVRAGKVVKVAYDSVLGLHVVVRHSTGDGYDSWYQHLSSETTYVGDTVSAGTKIGVQGETGSVSGSHLHFTLTKATSGAPDRSARISSDIATASKIHMNYVKYTKLAGSNCGL